MIKIEHESNIFAEKRRRSAGRAVRFAQAHFFFAEKTISEPPGGAEKDMSILVHDSNKAACRAAAAALQQGCRAALVRPAGTGKGRIVWEMLAEQPDTRVLWVASCAARLELRLSLIHI